MTITITTASKVEDSIGAANIILQEVADRISQLPCNVVVGTFGIFTIKGLVEVNYTVQA